MLLNSTTAYRPESQVCALLVCLTSSAVLRKLKSVRVFVVILGKKGNIKSFPTLKIEYCVVNLDGISCVYVNVVCKLVCRGIGLVYVSCVKSGRLVSEQNPGEPNPLLQMAINTSHPPTCPSQSNSNLHSARNLKRIAPQPLPTTSSRTRYAADFTLNLHPLYQPAHHRHTSPSAPNNTCTTHPLPSNRHNACISAPAPIHQTWKSHDTYTSPTPRHTNLHTTFTYTHEIPSRFTTQYHTKEDIKANI